MLCILFWQQECWCNLSNSSSKSIIILSNFQSYLLNVWEQIIPNTFWVRLTLAAYQLNKPYCKYTWKLHITYTYIVNTSCRSQNFIHSDGGIKPKPYPSRITTFVLYATFYILVNNPWKCRHDILWKWSHYLKFYITR